MQAHREGRDVLLAFKDDIAFALKKAYDTDFDDEAIILAKVANIVQRDMMNRNTRTFNGSFDIQCQQNSVPQRLQGLPAVPSSSTGQSLLILNSLFSYLYSRYVVETLRSTKMLCQRPFHGFLLWST